MPSVWWCVCVCVHVISVSGVCAISVGGVCVSSVLVVCVCHQCG